MKEKLCSAAAFLLIISAFYTHILPICFFSIYAVEISSTTNNFPAAVAVGAIVGSSVGGAMIVVLCIIVIVAMAICIKRKKPNKAQDEYELELKKESGDKPEDKNIYVEN